MKTKELIELLKEMPQDADVDILYHGHPRMPLNVVYLSKKGTVITTGYNQVVWLGEDRPVDAPMEDVAKEWFTINWPCWR